MKNPTRQLLALTFAAASCFGPHFSAAAPRLKAAHGKPASSATGDAGRLGPDAKLRIPRLRKGSPAAGGARRQASKMAFMQARGASEGMALVVAGAVQDLEQVDAKIGTLVETGIAAHERGYQALIAIDQKIERLDITKDQRRMLRRQVLTALSSADELRTATSKARDRGSILNHPKVYLPSKDGHVGRAFDAFREVLRGGDVSAAWQRLALGGDDAKRLELGGTILKEVVEAKRDYTRMAARIERALAPLDEHVSALTERIKGIPERAR